MDITNYLQNRLPTSCASDRKTAIIPKERWTGKKQNVSYIKLFGSFACTNIPKEQRNKSDHIRIWKEIFIRYANKTTKHFKIYASQTEQFIIISKPIIQEAEQGAKLLIKSPIKSSFTKVPKPVAGKSQPRDRPKKDKRPNNDKDLASKRQRLDTNTSIGDNSLNTKRIGENSYKELGPTPDERIGENSELGPTPDERIGENSYQELGPTPAKKIGKSLNKKLGPSFAHNDMHLRKEAAMSITETSSKVYEPKSYDEAIADPIHGTRWRQAIEEEIHNLEIYHTWEYEELPEDRKAIGCK